MVVTDVELFPNRIEEPSMGIDLLGVFLFETEHHLHRRKRIGIVGAGTDELLLGRDRELGRILELYHRVSIGVGV